MIKPERSVHKTIQIDTNRINAKGKLESICQLEKWRHNGVILLNMSRVAQIEAGKCDSERRKKASGYIYSLTCATTDEENEQIKRIEDILIPQGATTENQKNDVEIVFNAWKYASLLVTDDGGSKRQPGGILGNAEKLSDIGIVVMRDCEAVKYIKELIKERDEFTLKYCEFTKEEIPDWVGKD